MNNELKLKQDITIGQMRLDVESMKAILPVAIEYYKVAAKIHKAKFDACIKAGYTEAQAMGICGKI